MSKWLQPMFSSIILMVSCLTSRFFIHLEFIFVYGVRYWSSFVLLHIAVQFSQQHLLKRLSFFPWMFFPALSMIICPKSQGSISGFSVPLVYVSVFVPVPCCLCDHSFVVQLEIWQHDAPSFVFLFQHFLGDLGSFLVPYNFRIVCFSTLKNGIGILIRMALKV